MSDAPDSDPVTRSVDPADSIDQINIIIAQREALLGPLIQVGNNGAETLLTFDLDPPEPAHKAYLVTAATAPDGTSEVTRGTVFIGGNQTAVLAVRPVG